MTQSNRPTDPVVEAHSRGQYAGGDISQSRHHTRERHHRARAPPDDDEAGLDAMSIPQFCRRHAISQSFFFKLRSMGLAPAMMKVGARVLISRESAKRWRAAREIAAQQRSEAR
jgi:hypothetical protein